MSTTGKVNGDITDDDIVVNSTPCSQRKPRLNRRGFHLSNHPLMKLLSDKSDQTKADENGYDSATENKNDSTEKRIISLSTVKNSTPDKSSTVKSKQSSTIINLKKSSFSPNENRNGNSGATEVSSSGDPPPKKKHKPITWP